MSLSPATLWARFRAFFRKVKDAKPAPLALSTCYPLLQITADPARCDHCGVCSSVCPMDIDILAYIEADQVVASGDCILCQTCVNACPCQALDVRSSLQKKGYRGSRPHRQPVD